MKLSCIINIVNNNELLEQFNELKLNYQAYLSTREKEQIESIIQKIDTNEDSTLLEREYMELREKLDYRKSATNEIKSSLSDTQRNFIKDWSGKDVTEE